MAGRQGWKGREQVRAGFVMRHLPNAATHLIFFGSLIGSFLSLYSSSSIRPNFQSNLCTCHHPKANVKTGMIPSRINGGDLYQGGLLLFAP